MNKIYFILFSFIIFGYNSSGQTIYSVPFAYTQPKFVFPLYFEEGSGMRDTLYFCYDPNSVDGQLAPQDSIFGQKLIPIDTLKFYACFLSDNFCNLAPAQCDSQYKLAIGPAMNGRFPSVNEVILRNGVQPVKISWDSSILYSDSLPFQNSGLIPRAQGRISVNVTTPFIQISENGSIFPSIVPFPYLISDTGGLGFKDSCVIFTFNGSGQEPVEEIGITLWFEQWTGIATNVSVEQSEFPFSVFPNPFVDHITVSIPSMDKINSISIFNINGKQIMEKIFTPKDNILKLELELMPGLYFMKIEGLYKTYCKIICNQ